MKSFASLLPLLALVSAAACAGKASLEDRPCPCADGWVCCPSRNVCVADGVSCSNGSTSASSSSGSSSGDAGVAVSGPIELAVAQSARCMATDREHLYWANADGLVLGNAKKGGELQTSSFHTPVATNPLCGIAVDGDQLFTTAYEYGKIVQLSLSSNGDWAIGAQSSFFGQLTTPSSLSLDDDAVYVTEYEAGRVTKVPRTRAASTVLAEGLQRPHGIVEVGDTIVFAERGTVDADAGTAMNGAIKRVPKAGGDVVVLAANQQGLDGLAVWDGRAYWTANRSVWSVDLEGGVPQKVASGLGASAPIAVDGKFVFFADYSSLKKAPLAGGDPVDFTDGLVVSLTIDEARVFWSDGNRVVATPK